MTPILEEGELMRPVLRRSPGMDFTTLNEEIDKLKAKNNELTIALGRKYAHVNKLKRKISALEKNMDEIIGLGYLSELDDASQNLSILGSQSGTEGTSAGDGDADPTGQLISSGQASLTQKITAFADEDAGWTTTAAGGYDPTMDLAHNPDGNLGEFLSRPIRARVDSWVVGQPLFYSDNVWQTFLTNPFVAEKIANYELIRMKLHARLIISGTKFHYGRAIAGYNPLAGSLDEVTVSRNFLDVDIVQLSQKPHVFLNPTKNTGGTIDMPFMFPKNYISLNEPSDSINMGELVVKSFGNLLHANGGDDPVTVTLYLWATDVVLTMPTSQNTAAVLASQAGKQSNKKKPSKNQINAQDEYGSGIISKPAAMISKAAGILEDLPLIRPYAVATQMVADKVGAVAKIFGYSRPSVITDIQLFKPNPTGNLANADAADAVHKLTLDSKAELTVDSRTVGLDGRDQMGIKDIAMRESYLTSFAVTTTDAVDALLWNAAVTPVQYALNSGEIHPTPMAMIANSFESWQGSIKFRFQVVKSDFHKGKLLVRYDPNVNSAIVNYNTNYSRVIDLAEEDDFEIVVGWAQAKAWLDCTPMVDNSTNFDDTNRLLKPEGFGNGVLEVNVLNTLVSPSVDSDISINVYVSACDDIRFAAPTNKFYQSLHIFPEVTPVRRAGESEQILDSQSGMESDVVATDTDRPVCGDEVQMIASKGDITDNTSLVFYGDPPTTLRELFKRYQYSKTYIPLIPAEGTLRTNILTSKDLPYQTGWDPNGIDLSEVNGTTKLTVAQKGAIAWFAPCFAAYRGAMRKKYAFGGKGNNSVIRRDYVNGGNGGFSYNSQANTSDEARIAKAITKFTHPDSMQGASLTNLGINDVVEVELPFYQENRLASTRIVDAQALQSNSHRVVSTSYQGTATGNTLAASSASSMECWEAAGEDFTLFFWTGAPILYQYVVTATS